MEKNDCVHVPREGSSGWTEDKLADLPSKPLQSFRLSSLRGTWYKVMGLDSSYDCFDCQRNSFTIEDKKTIGMHAVFRIPRPTAPGYLQSDIKEELRAADADSSSLATLHSQGEMFGLTFWENWYVLGERNVQNIRTQKSTGDTVLPSAYAASTSSDSIPSTTPDLKLIFYTGHTLQGNYKGDSSTHRALSSTSFSNLHYLRL